ncbi:MAG TPA: F0F1 ATP synthase subunit A [Casimicrobiaceae bacterium]|jgi:F-type H+-transporting ATPase subunit a|nr:F0F1 ATP synthase subunit A [Casimicrobiaceae bacterium]
MAAGTELTATEYIQHHLTFLQYHAGKGAFWTINVDTMVMTVVAAVLSLGVLWLFARRATTGVPSKRQAFAELTIDWLGNQVKDIYHGPSTLVAPIALTTGVLVLLLNAMDWLPIDVMAWFYEHVLHVEHWRNTPTADVNTTFALALSVFALMIFYSIKVKGLGGWLHELIGTPFGLKPLWASPLLILANLMFQIVEYVSKPLSHSLRLFGNMYAGEIIFLLLGMWAATGIWGVFWGGFFHILWAGFHLIIVPLQAYIFMMLTVVYIAMAHEHH